MQINRSEGTYGVDNHGGGLGDGNKSQKRQKKDDEEEKRKQKEQKEKEGEGSFFLVARGGGVCFVCTGHHGIFSINIHYAK